MPTCADCTYYDDYLQPQWCYVYMEYHDPDDICSQWQGKNERVDMWTGEKLGPLDGPGKEGE